MTSRSRTTRAGNEWPRRSAFGSTWSTHCAGRIGTGWASASGHTRILALKKGLAYAPIRVVASPTSVVDKALKMALPVLSKLELKVMHALWDLGACSVREIQKPFREKKRPAYTTVQTMVYRLEAKKALIRGLKISIARVFTATI